MIWRAILTIAVSALACAEAGADCRSAPARELFPELAADAAAAGPTDTDRVGRIVAPIHVNGQGPYRFIIDTGANRSALSARLVQRLGLAPSAEGEVHSVYGVAVAPIVAAQSLRYENLALPSAQLPILDGAVLAGEHGLLGVDGMEGRRLLLDFERRCIEIEPSRGARRLASLSWAHLRGELRFGRLVVVRGRISGVRVNVLIDTGSDTSLANMALYEALQARLRRMPPQRAATATAPILLNRAVVIPRLNLGPMEANNFAAYVGDFHVFALWNMIEEPTLLLGMDVLSQSRAMAIDYGRANVYFRLPQ